MSTTTNKPTSSSSNQAAKIQAYIDGKIESTRRQVKSVDLLAGVLWMVVFVVAFFLVAAIVDAWVWPLGSLGRWVGLIALIGGIVALLVGTLLPLVSRKINPDYAAKMIEDAKPGFRNSVLNYVALKRKPESIKAAVLDAVSRQAATDLSNIPKDETVDRSKLIQLGIILIGLVAAAMLYGLMSPKNPLTTVGRILFPSADLAKPAVVRVTDVAPGDARVFFGDPLLVSARISGVYEAEDVRLIYSTADGQLIDQVLSMEADPTRSGRYQVDLGGETGIRQTLSYQVIAGDGQSAKYEIIVEPKPAITIESIRIEPPQYTGLPTQQQSVGSIEAAEGSQVYVTATANLPIDRAYIQMLREVSTANDVKYVDVGGGQKMRVADQTAEGRFQLVMDADRLQPFATHYRLEFFSTDGNRNEQANIHPIRIIPDLAPEIKIQHPQQSEVSVPVNGSLPVVIEATELDYRLTAVKLIGEFRGRNVLDQSLPLQFQDDGKRHASCNTSIRPQDLGLSAGDQLLFYAIAADNRTSYYSEEEPDPNVSRTGNYILVVTEADPEAEQQPDPDPENSGAEQQQDPAQNGFRENQPDENEDANDPGESNQDQSQDPAADGQPEDQQPGDENQPSQPNDPDGGMKPEQQAGTDPQQENQDPAGQNPDNNQQNNATDPGQQSSGGSDSQGGNQAQQQEGSEGSGQAGTQQNGQSSGQQEDSQSGSSGSQSGSQTGGNQDPSGSQSGSQNSSSNNSSSSANSGRNADSGGGSSNDSPAQSGAQNDPGNAQTTRGSGEPGQQQPGEGSSNADGPERRDSNLTEGKREQLPADASDARRMRELQKLMDEGKLDQPSGEQNSTDSKQGSSTDPNQDQQGNPGQAGGNPNESDPGSESAAGSDSDAQDGSGKTADDEQGDQSAQGSPTGNDQGQPGDSPAGDQQQPGQSGNDSDTGQGNQGDETMDPSGQDSQSGNSERGSDQGSGTETGDNPSGSESSQSSEGGSDSGSGTDASEKESGQGAESKPAEKSSDDPSGSEGMTDRPSQSGQPGDSQQGSGGSEGEGDSQSQEGEPGGQSGGNAGQESNSGQEGQSGQEGSKNSSDSGQSGNVGQPGQEGESGQPGDSGQASQQGNAGQQGDPAQSGQPGQGGQDGASQQGADSNSQSGSQSSSGSSQSSGSAGASNGSSDSGASQGGGGAMSGSEETPVDQQNLNHAKKATDLVLNRLSDQKNEPDQDLLDRLNMNQQDFKEFVERWEQMRDAATKGDPDAQRRYERAIKSIGLRPQGSLRSTARNQDRPEGLSQDGDVLRVRPELRRDFEAFQQDLNRSQR